MKLTSLFPIDTVAVIPAAGGMRGMWSGLSSASCDAMLSIAGKPAIYWTLQELLRVGIKRVAIAVQQRDNDLERFVQLIFGARMDLQFVCSPCDRGVGYSVLLAAQELPPKVPLLVILGDTIAQFEGALPGGDFVFVKEVEDSCRWCMACVKSGRVTGLMNKPAKPLPDMTHALTGIYFFSQGWEDFSDLVSHPSKEGKLELSDLLKKAVLRGSLHAVTAVQWVDVGNPDHVFDAHSRMIQARSFNRLEINRVQGTITKRSTESAKFYDEINYYKLLPERLKIYYPRIVASDITPHCQSLTMELYGYPSLADSYVFWKLSPKLWFQIFKRLREICDDFHGDNYGPGAGIVEEIYLQKNRNRLEKFIQNPPACCRSIIDSNALRINGEKVLSMTQAFARSEPLLKDLCANSRLSVVHGDMCFSNILCEPSRGLIKFIDPRGSFGRQGVLGDPRYDRAKLLHSVEGFYDYIIADIYSCKVEGASIELKFPVDADNAQVRAYFSDVFGDLVNNDETILITAWLFLSMLPLHADDPRRQFALASRGLSLLSKIL